VGATDGDLEWFDLPLDDEEYAGEPETEFFDEEMYSSPESSRREKPYPLQGEVSTATDGRVVTTQEGISNHSGHYGGLRVETTYEANQPPNVKQVRRASGLQPLTSTTAVRLPRKKQLTDADAARPGFEVIGEDPSQDVYAGLSGKELHMERMLQAEYERDLKSRGFDSPSESPFI